MKGRQTIASFIGAYKFDVCLLFRCRHF